MFRRDLLRAVLASPLAGWLGVRSSHAVEAPNAAAIYGRALAWASGVGLDDANLLHEAAKGGDIGPRVDALIREARSAIAALREASAVGRCDWGPPVLSSDDLLKGRLDFNYTRLIQAASLSARRLAEEGRGREALDDAFAALALAHRIGTGAVLVGRIFESSGEVVTFGAIGRILPRLDRRTLDDLARRLDALPPPEPASAVIGPESGFILGMVREELGRRGPTVDDAFWAGLGFDEGEVATFRRRFGGDRAAILAHLETYGPAFAEMARRLDLPRPGCRAALEEFGRAERLDHPFAASPSLIEKAWAIRTLVDRMLALRVMTRAGLALVRDGEPAFRAIRDPFGDGPFVLDGRTIRSALRDEGKPEVSLAIGEDRPQSTRRVAE